MKVGSYRTLQRSGERVLAISGETIFEAENRLGPCMCVLKQSLRQETSEEHPGIACDESFRRGSGAQPGLCVMLTCEEEAFSCLWFLEVEEGRLLCV